MSCARLRMKKTALRSNPEKTLAWINRSRKPLPKTGKRTQQWEKVRRNLKPKFERAGITSCELRWPGCWKDNALGFAHAKHRRNLGPGELSIVILVCNICHDLLDKLPDEDTEHIVMKTISERKIQP